MTGLDPHQCCRACPSLVSCSVTRGKPSKLAVVLDWPSESEVRHDQWLNGKRGGASDLLKSLLEHFVDLDEIYITSAVNCRPNPTKKAMHKNAMLSCRQRLVDELKDIGAEKVLCAGPVGFGALMSSTKLEGITNIRGRWREAYGMKVMATLPPGFAIAQPEYFRDIERDLTKFFETDGPEPHPNVDVWVPENLAEAREAFAFISESEFIAVDLETTGFSPHACLPLAAGFGILDGKDATVIVLDEALLEKRGGVWKLIEKLLSGPLEVVFHNAKFDLKFLRAGLESRGLTYDPQNIHDTMMLNYALDERPMGKFKAHALEKLASVRYDAPTYGIQMGKFLQEWETADELERRSMRERLHVYLGLDVYYTARLYPDLYNECLDEDERLLDLYDTIFMPGTLALADVEYHGLLLDVQMYEKTRKELTKKSNTILARIQRSTGIPDFNPGSPQQVKKHVYGTLGLTIDAGLEAAVAQITGVEAISSRKEGIRSRGTYTDPARLKSSATAAPVLRMIARGHPEHAQFLEDVCEWRNYSKNAGTYVEGLLRRVDVDGRVHGTFNIHGTASGRISSTDPNLQNMPPASHTGIAIRSGFLAPPGYSLLDLDYKQLEVRMAAQLSGDPAMKELFESGGDPHAETSHIIYGREDVSHYERMLGKILTFGLLYGRSPDSIATGPEAEDIVARGGKRWAPADVREFFGNLLSNWAVYAEWRQRCREAPYKDGEITFSVGRKRRFHFVPKHDGGHMGRQGINTPCQGTASDFCLYALIRLHEVLKPYDAQVISTVHDSLLVECKDEQLDEVIPLVTNIMEEDTLWPILAELQGLDFPTVPLKVDLKVCKRWSEDDDAEYAGTTIEDE